MFDLLKAFVYGGMVVTIYSLLQVAAADVDMQFIVRLMQTHLFQFYVLMVSLVIFGLEMEIRRQMKKININGNGSI
jgi:hypothetical protein